MSVRIQIRRDTAANWVSANPTLRAGEIGIETDTLKFKIGTGNQTWTAITAYANVVPTDLNNTLNGYLEVSDLSKNEGVGVAELLDGNLTLPGLNIIFEGTVDNHELTLTAPDVTSDKTVTLPNATTTLVGTDTTDTLTNKTLTSPVVSGLTLSDASIVFEGAVADSYETTLTVGEPTADNVLTLPDATDTLVGRATTDTLTNKTLTSPLVSGLTITDGSIIVEGTTADANETTLLFTDPTADRTITFPNATGTVAFTTDVDTRLALAGGTMAGAIAMGTNKITGLGAPTEAADAATKSYVDNTTAGLNFHAAVHAATTANLDATYSNGTGGVGATLTANANGALVVDGHTLNVDERVLLKNQTAGLENGIYSVTATGDVSNPFVLTRATDADNSPSGEVSYGDFTFVQQGTVNAGFGYIVNTTGTITIGTTAISYVQFNAGQVVVAGNGLTESTPGTLSINTGVTVDLNTAQTLTNKTLTSPVINTPTGISKSDVGLANVDNTSDANKPVSTATQTALDLKIDESLFDAKGDLLVGSADNVPAKLTVGTNGYLLTANSEAANGVEWAAAPVSLPSQTGNNGYYLTTNGTSASWAALVVPIETGTATLTANTATTVSTTALSAFTSIEYMVSLKQGSKIRTSKVVMQTDGTSVDMTEFAITETGGTMSGVVVSATTASTDGVLQVTVTDASSTNVDVKFSKVKL